MRITKDEAWPVYCLMDAEGFKDHIVDIEEDFRLRIIKAEDEYAAVQLELQRRYELAGGD